MRHVSGVVTAIIISDNFVCLLARPRHAPVSGSSTRSEARYKLAVPRSNGWVEFKGEPE